MFWCSLSVPFSSPVYYYFVDSLHSKWCRLQVQFHEIILNCVMIVVCAPVENARYLFSGIECNQKPTIDQDKLHVR